MVAINDYFRSWIRLWDVETGELIHELNAQAEVASIAFSPDGKLLASGSADNTVYPGYPYDDVIRLWDVETGETIRFFEEQKLGIGSLAFSPDGSRLVTGGLDSAMYLWDVETGEQLLRFDALASQVNQIVFSPNGQFVLSGGDDGLVRLWDAETGEVVQIFRGHSDGVISVAFSPDGALILSGSEDHTARLWNVRTGEQLQVLEGHIDLIRAIAFTPDGEQALTGSGDGTMRVWNLVVLDPIGRPLLPETPGDMPRVFEGHSNSVSSVAFNHDGTMAYSAGPMTTLRVWSLEANSTQYVVTWVGFSGTYIALTPDGMQLLSGGSVYGDGLPSETSRMHLWDVETGRRTHTFLGHEGWVSAIAVSSDGRRAVSAGEDRTVRVWDIETGEVVRVFEVGANRVTSVAFSPDGTHILYSSLVAMQMWDVNIGELLFTSDYGAMSAVYSPDGKVIIYGGSDGKLHLLDVETGEIIRVFEGHTNWVNNVVFSPDGTKVLSGSRDNTLRLWDVVTGETIRVFSGHKGSVLSMAFSPDGTRIITGGTDGRVRYWYTDYRDLVDYACTRVLRELTDHERERYYIDEAPTCPSLPILNPSRMGYVIKVG